MRTANTVFLNSMNICPFTRFLLRQLRSSSPFDIALCKINALMWMGILNRKKLVYHFDRFLCIDHGIVYLLSTRSLKMTVFPPIIYFH